jgi:hypothetical protein
VILNAMITKAVNWEVENGCEVDVGAHVFENSGIAASTVTITLCNPKFFGLPAWPRTDNLQSRAGGVLHEFSHLVASTNDGDHNQPVGKKGDATHNAYNLEYFAQAVGIRLTSK